MDNIKALKVKFQKIQDAILMVSNARRSDISTTTIRNFSPLWVSNCSNNKTEKEIVSDDNLDSECFPIENLYNDVVFKSNAVLWTTEEVIVKCI